MVIDEQALGELDAEQLREVSQRLLAELRHQRALNEKLAYECALLKRLKFAAKSERHSAEQRTGCCTAMKRRWPCSNRATARHTGPTCGLTHRVRLKT
ncbi:hypothetical protein [Hydrogenophaga sp. NH-16]|uniref:hypothetical protein n=1 Tax=Hydrogenophaga sp. NH-16 TaxID=2184519 RepID=UPI0019D45980|nr:hypothetical protein [Hydrogenophaga sp. NH-16]